MKHIPYKGASLAMTGQLSGEVDMVTSTVPSTIPYINGGRLRGLVVMAKQRVSSISKVPTSAEAGMPCHGVSSAVTAPMLPTALPP